MSLVEHKCNLCFCMQRSKRAIMFSQPSCIWNNALDIIRFGGSSIELISVIR